MAFGRPTKKYEPPIEFDELVRISDQEYKDKVRPAFIETMLQAINGQLEVRKSSGTFVFDVRAAAIGDLLGYSLAARKEILRVLVNRAVDEFGQSTVVAQDNNGRTLHIPLTAFHQSRVEPYVIPIEFKISELA